MNNGIKESKGKLNIEYDWDFLKAQMIRMAKNKDKYPKNNWRVYQTEYLDIPKLIF